MLHTYTVRKETRCREQNRAGQEGALWSRLCVTGYTYWSVSGSWRAKFNSAAVLGFLPASKHLAEVGTRCPLHAHTHTQTHTHTHTLTYTIVCFIRCPPMSWQPYILSKREDALCQKNAMVTFFFFFWRKPRCPETFEAY